MSRSYYRLNLDATLRELLLLLAESKGPVAHTHFGGATRGLVLTEYQELAPTELLIDEDGDLVSVAALRGAALGTPSACIIPGCGNDGYFRVSMPALPIEKVCSAHLLATEWVEHPAACLAPGCQATSDTTTIYRPRGPWHARNGACSAHLNVLGTRWLRVPPVAR